MLEQVLNYLKNWFITEIQSGTYTIENGTIELSFLQTGQYFRIMGSVFNDGLYLYDENLELKDETFDGVIWALAIPQMILDITKQIEEWQDKYGEVAAGPYTSESFGGYSYSKGSGSSGSDSDASWQSKFAGMLAPYRKLRETGAISGDMGYQDPSYHRPFNPDFPWG